MLTFFNTQTLYVGNDFDRFNQIRSILEANGIDYKPKVRSFHGRARGRRGSFGLRGEGEAYEILVKTADYPYCRHLIYKY